VENASEIRNSLEDSDPNFQRLARKHREYEQRLEELRSRKFLTADERIEETNIKKHKLALKDQMEEILRNASR
jgi:uncharacterized protein YdcH (DUF465 family)